MPSIFSKIINGEIPSYKVYEDENCFAFLDINPNAVGHTLCVTKKEVDKLFDLSHKDYNLLMEFSRKVEEFSEMRSNEAATMRGCIQQRRVHIVAHLLERWLVGQMAMGINYHFQFF